MSRRTARSKHGHRSRHLIKRLRAGWKVYLIQSVMAAAVTFLVLWVVTLEHAVIVASIGSMAFLVFIRPRSYMAQPRNLILGQLFGLIAGITFGWLHHMPIVDVVLADALAVGVCVLLMVVFQADHSPAAGTALGVTIAGGQPSVVLAVISSVAILVLAHGTLQKWLKDL